MKKYECDICKAIVDEIGRNKVIVYFAGGAGDFYTKDYCEYCQRAIDDFILERGQYVAQKENKPGRV